MAILESGGPSPANDELVKQIAKQAEQGKSISPWLAKCLILRIELDKEDIAELSGIVNEKARKIFGARAY